MVLSPAAPHLLCPESQVAPSSGLVPVPPDAVMGGLCPRQKFELSKFKAFVMIHSKLFDVQCYNLENL